MKRWFHAIIIVLLFFILLSCTGNEEAVKDDEDYILEYWTTDVYESGIWLIYFYHPLCSACHFIYDDVQDFYKNYRSSYPVYYLNASNNTGPPPSEDITLVPTMVVYEGDNYIEHFIGVSAILDLLDLLKNDNYQTP